MCVSIHGVESGRLWKGRNKDFVVKQASMRVRAIDETNREKRKLRRRVKIRELQMKGRKYETREQKSLADPRWSRETETRLGNPESL